METGDYRGTVVDKLPHLLSTKNSRRCLPPDFLLSSAVVRSPRCIFSWRDAAQRCGRHDKNDPLFSGFSSLQSSEIIVFPGRIKVSHGKPTEKWVVFIRAGKLCRSSALGGGIVEKGGGGAFCQQFRHPACRLTLLQRVRRANETLY